MMLKPFSISPSYQSELSDCSFFPPTHSSLAREEPRPAQAQQPNGYYQPQVSVNMLLLTSNWNYCSP